MRKRNLFTRFYRFFKFNNDKKLSLLCWYYSAVYRFQILHVDSNKLHKKWGIEGEESATSESEETYRYCRTVSRLVSQICRKTSWESKCLVRAWTAQTLLKRMGIESTLYLGCGYQDGKMVAHAWLRCGEMYVTGGDGHQYAMVDKFKSTIN